jgi:undecaprenyl-diphosphatase
MKALVPGVAVAAMLGVTGVQLADVVMDNGGRIGGDESVLSWIVGHRDAALTMIAQVITTVGATPTLAAMAGLVVALLLWRGQRPEAALVAVTTAGAAVLVVVTKQVVGRARPPLADQLVVETNQSFPSGHTLGATAVLGVLTVVALGYIGSRRARALTVWAGGALIVLIGLSRLYLGVHWATDVLAGWLLGGAWLAVCVTGWRSTR